MTIRVNARTSRGSVKTHLPLRALIENSTDIITVLAPDGTVRFQSPSGKRILGYQDKEMVGKCLADYVHSADQASFAGLLSSLSFKPEEPACATFQMRHRDGSWRFLEAIGKAVTSGGKTMIVVNSRDATDRRRAELATLESQARLAAIVDSAMDAVIMLDAAQRIVTFNGAAEQMFGYAAREMIGQPLDLLIPQRSVDAHRRHVDAFGHSNTTIRSIAHLGILHGRRSNGQEFPAEISISRAEVCGSKIYAAIVRDTTQREQAKADLEESAERYRHLFENNPQPMWVYDLETLAFLEVNEAARRHYGYSRDEFLSMTIKDIRPAEDVPALMNNVAHTIESMATSGAWRHRKKDGTLIDVEIVSHSINYGGRPSRLVLASDVTARKRAEQELVNQRNLLQTLIDHLPDYVFIKDRDSHFVVDNASHLRLLRVERQEQTAGKTDFDFFSPELAERYFADEQAVVRSGQPLINREEATINPEGKPQWLETTKLPLRDNSGTIYGLVGISRDITERKRSEEEIRRRADEFAALYDTARDLAGAQELATVLKTIVERAAALLGAASGSVFLYDPARQDLEIVVVTGQELAVGTRFQMGEGMAGRVALSHEPIVVDDYRTWEHRSPQMQGLRVASSVAVPMLYGGRLIGVLAVNEAADSEHRFMESDARLLSLFGSYAASAVHNARLLEETRQRAEQLAQLYDLGLKLSRTLDPRAQLELLFEGAMKALHADRVEFSRYDEAHAELVVEGARGYSSDKLAGLRGLRLQLEDDRGIIGRVGRQRRPLLVSDVSAEAGWIAVDPELRSGVWAPVEYENRLLGVLGVLSEHANAFTDQDRQVLTLFANQAAVALENGRLFDETNRRLSRIRALHAIDLAIGGSIDLTFTLDVFLEQALSQLQIDAGDILRLEPHTQTLEYVAGRGFRTKALSQTRLRMGEGYAGRAALERRTVTVPTLSGQDREFNRPRLFAHEQFVSYYAVPLRAKGQVKGVLELFHRSPLERDQEWLDFLETLAGQAAIAIDNAGLFDDLQHSNVELALAYDTTIEGWSRALDLRDKETEGHTQRVTQLTLDLCRAMGFGEEELVQVRRGALLHDIGKVGIPDSILLKPGPLTQDAWQIMRTHPEHAHHLLAPIGYLRRALEIPYCHHERYNGSGYPRGLKGEEIPLSARIFAVVDVWDALLSTRPYREAWPKARAREHILAGSGTEFDPKVVRTFFELVDAGA